MTRAHLDSDVAVVVLPRETLRGTGAALDRLRALVPSSTIVAVDIAGAGAISDDARNDPRVRLVTTPGFVLPFEARNLALEHTRDAAWVVFVDTNATPAPGCIDALVAAARESGAGCVHPLIMFEQGGRERVHAARCVLEDRAGLSFPRIEDMGADPSSLPGGRRPDDYGELHLALFSRAALEVIAPFPPLSIAEDIEIAMRLRAAGIGSLLESAARATYLADPIRDSLDRDYFRFRWGARFARHSIERLRRWPIDGEYWVGKRRWLHRHRWLVHPAFDVALRARRGITEARARLRARVVARLEPSSVQRSIAPLARASDAPSVTVIIPVRAPTSFLAEAVASARAQGDVVGRVIIVVDGADDDTEAAARQAGADLVLTLPSPRGAAAARNEGARAAAAGRAASETAATKWLVFLDADDRLREGAVTRLLAAASLARAVVVYGEAAPIEVDGTRVGADRAAWFAPRPTGDVRRALLAANPIATTGAALVDAAAFLRAGGFREDLPRAHDWALWCRLSSLGSFAYVGVPAVVERRWHRASISSTLGTSVDATLRAIEAVFGDAAVVAGVAPHELAQLRRSQEAGAYALAATERLKIDDVAGARPLLVDALRRRPRIRETVLLACATFGALPSGVRRRLR